MSCTQLVTRQTDRALVGIVRNGEVTVFGVLVDRYYASLVRHLTYRTGDPELAADLAQDAFLDAFRHLDRFREERPFAAWLYRIAQNRLRMALRRRRLRQFVSLDWRPLSIAANPVWQQPDATGPCHERDLLRQVLDGLSPLLREALLLHSLDGFSAPEVAQILGISRSAAERRISRAKEQFRERYRELNRDDREDGAPVPLPARVR
jgi:RNA polymerase sigma-70 factor (ECF subfamily)